MAAGPSLTDRARALLRAGARELRADVLLGGVAARARRVDGEGGPQGVDAGADLRRGNARLRRSLERAGGPRAARRSRRSRSSSSPTTTRRGSATRSATPSATSSPPCWPIPRAGLRPSRTRSSRSTCRSFFAPMRRRPTESGSTTPRITPSRGSSPFSPISRDGTPAGMSARRPSRRASSAIGGCTSAFPEQDDRAAIVRDLEGRLPAMADLPWFAMGQAQLAELLEQGDRPDRLVRAREAARRDAGRIRSRWAGGAAFRSSEGSRRRATSSQAMKTDGPDRRSILVSHRNVATLTFRAYAVDLPGRVASERDLRRILPAGKEIERLLAERPAAQWSLALPATPDFLDHRTFVVPPMKTKGYYLVAASGDSGFGAGGGFPVVAAGFLVSDLVLVETPGAPAGGDSRRSVEILALSGETGRPLGGVAITVLQGRWNPTGADRIAEATTDASRPRSARIRRREGMVRALRFRAPRRRSRRLDGDAFGLAPGAGRGPDDLVARLHRPEHLPARCRRSSGRCSRTRATPREGRFARFPRDTGDRHALRPERPVGRGPDRHDQRLRHRRRASSRFRPDGRSAPGGSRRSLEGAARRCASRSTSGRPSR